MVVTISLSPQGRAYTRALKSEKSLSPPIPVGGGAVDTNYWCIIAAWILTGDPQLGTKMFNRCISWLLFVISTRVNQIWTAKGSNKQLVLS